MDLKLNSKKWEIIRKPSNISKISMVNLGIHYKFIKKFLLSIRNRTNGTRWIKYHKK